METPKSAKIDDNSNCEYMGMYYALTKRTNALEHRMGQIAMILREDISDEPIKDF